MWPNEGGGLISLSHITFLMLPGLQNISFMYVLESRAISCSDLQLIFTEDTFSLQCKIGSSGNKHTALCFKVGVNAFIIRGQIFNVSCKLTDNW